MFEKELLTLLINNFVVSGFTLAFGFGEVPEKTAAPYIAMHPLNNDGTRQVLCDNDDYTDGDTSIQFSIYAKDYSNACYIGKQLDTFLANIRYLTHYSIILNNSEVIRGFPTVDTGLSLETVTRRFTYTKNRST